MTSRLLRYLCFVVLCTIFLAGVARAQSCTASITDINFGNVDTLSGAPVDVTGTVSVTCTSGVLTNVQACVSIGVGSGGATSGSRQMRNAGNALLNFQLFRDPARTVRWGSTYLPELGSAAPTDFGRFTGTRTQNIPIYARIPGNQQSAAPGLYTSTFSGLHVALDYRVYLLIPTDCPNVSEFTQRATFNVMANVVPNCRVTAQNIDFGNHGVLDSALDATGGLSITCTSGTAYSVALNNGLSGTSPVDRRMTLSDQSVSYGLYMDPARTQPWGSSVSQQLSGTGTGATENVPVYGRVPAQTTPPPGTYTDTVVVTVTY